MSAIERILTFTGAMAPVFTPFKTNGAVHVSQVEPYARKLIRNGVKGVFLFGTTGEGYSLGVEEKISLVREWVAVRQKLRTLSSSSSNHGDASDVDLVIVAVVSSTSTPDVVRLAQECTRAGVDAIALQPPLYYRPTIEGLVTYLKVIGGHLPDMPLIYYHIPPFVGDWVDIVDLVERLSQKAANFVGIKYSSFDIVTAVRLDRRLRTAMAGRPFKVFCGYDQALCSLASGLGVDGAICASFNLEGMGRQYEEMLAAVRRGDLAAARAAQDTITDCVEECGRGLKGFFPTLRETFNRESSAELIFLGRCRFPLEVPATLEEPEPQIPMGGY